MRVAPLIAILLLAGCASPDASNAGAPTPTASPSPTPASPTPATPPATAPAIPVDDGVKLGVVLDETHDYTGSESRSFFNVTGGERAVVINITSSGPPADRSFQSATLNFYFPNTTSPFVGDLPGQEARSFEMRQQPHHGMWKVEYLGTGKVTVSVRVTLE